MSDFNPFSEFAIFNSVKPITAEVKLPSISSLDDLSFLNSPVYYQESQTQERLPRMTDSGTTEQQSSSQKVQELSQTTPSSTQPAKDVVSLPVDDKSLDVSFEELIKQEKLPIKITSGYRGPKSWRGGKTAQGRVSNHSRLDAHGNPMAYDIAPTQGKTFDDLRQILYRNPRVVAWFKKRGWGILEEMQDGKNRGFYDIRGKFHYTGATGPHFHLGPDSLGREWYNNQIAKGQQGMRFPLQPDGIPFQVFDPVETPKVEINLPLLNEPLDITEWASEVRPNGTIMVQDRLPRMTDSGQKQQQVIQQPETQQQTQQQTETKTQIKQSKGADALSKLIDEVSNESGFEGLKDPETKKIIMLQAQRESNFTPTAQAKGSTAAGYFQFIDQARKSFSGLSRSQFLNNPKEQVKAAYRMYQYIHNYSDAKKLLAKGYNKAQVTALGWWYPRAMGMVLNNPSANFSLGGYSIKQALNDYK